MAQAERSGSPSAGQSPSVAAPLWRTVSLLGVAQIISWGSLYYTLTVLAAPIRQELEFNDLMIFGAFTLGQLVSGVAAPWVGRRIDSAGGRGRYDLGSFTAALALVVVAIAREPVLFTAGWLLAGLSMAACLYDPAFASLYQIAPDRYRRAVTGLTLFRRVRQHRLLASLSCSRRDLWMARDPSDLRSATPCYMRADSSFRAADDRSNAVERQGGLDPRSWLREGSAFRLAGCDVRGCDVRLQRPVRLHDRCARYAWLQCRAGGVDRRADWADASTRTCS